MQKHGISTDFILIKKINYYYCILLKNNNEIITLHQNYPGKDVYTSRILHITVTLKDSKRSSDFLFLSLFILL